MAFRIIITFTFTLIPSCRLFLIPKSYLITIPVCSVYGSFNVLVSIRLDYVLIDMSEVNQHACSHNKTDVNTGAKM